MKIGLDSDFRDFYDHWFDLPPHNYVLKRIARPKKGISKRNQFELLEQAGFTTPLHGLVRDVWAKTRNDYLVVYDDEFAHCGKGKILAHRTKAAMQASDKYCSVFIPTTPEPTLEAESSRLLAIGNRLFWLKYRSNDWMSNHAEIVDISVTGETLNRDAFSVEGGHDFDFLNRYPLFAIDFVQSLHSGRLLAVDFNSAPGLKGTGMEDFVSPAKVVELISEFVWLNRIVSRSNCQQ